MRSHFIPTIFVLSACSSAAPLFIGYDGGGGDAQWTDADPGGDAIASDAADGGTEPNDASSSDADAAPDVVVKSGPWRVFLSSTYYQERLGGASGVDALCAGLASDAGLGGNWKAWISTTTASAKTRLNQLGGPFKLLNGTVIANDWAGLTSGSLLAPINVDEQGHKNTTNDTVLTGTTPSGDLADAGATGSTCDDWAYPLDAGAYQYTYTGGYFQLTTSEWTEWSSAIATCGFGSGYLYCFEQP